jgi:hypothetical protein
MSSQASIHHAVVTDASDISKLIVSTSETCCFSEAAPCPDWYLNSIQTQAIATLIASERMVFLLAMHGQAVAGVLAIEDKSSIKYFFCPSRSTRNGHRPTALAVCKEKRDVRGNAQSAVIVVCGSCL